jgi:hypothetical protein
MSEVKVNKISPRSGTDVTLGDSGDTFTIPAGATLTNNGTASGFASIAWQSDIKTSAFTAVAGEGYWINTTSSAITITLPASASVGDQIIFTDYARTWGTNAVTVNQNSLNFQGQTSPNPEYNTSGQSVNIVYSGATQGWIPNSDDDVTNEVPQDVDIEYLVVAGGGGGGSTWTPNVTSGAGGGAGGYLTNYGGSALTLGNGITYTITVGTGGTGAATSANNGTAGTNSSISGSDITDVVSTGGGGGGSSTAATGQDGGSGGGGGATRGGGSGNTPSTTPSQGNNGGSGSGSSPNYGAGGGGGASAVGLNGSSTVGGNGGNGSSNSITGSAVTYAGGGGGGNYDGGTVGSGGTGGGGNAGANSGAVGGNGTDGLGGGGGGASYSSPGPHYAGGDGGNGVVIIRMTTADYGNVTATGTFTTAVDGLDTVITWTADGTLVI